MSPPRPTEAVGGLAHVEWELLFPDVMANWEPGDHFAILGPTKSGKSTLELGLAHHRAASLVDRGVVVLGTKPRDATLTKWIGAHRAAVVKSWREVGYAERKNRRIVVWPEYGRASTAPARNKPVFLDVIDGVMLDGDWTLVIDETAYMVEQLGMRSQVDELWNAARSNVVTVMSGAQRGSWINRSMASQMSWAAGFRFQDQDDAKRVAEIFGDRGRFTPLLQSRKRHHFILLQTVTGLAYDTVLPAPPKSAPASRERRSRWRR